MLQYFVYLPILGLVVPLWLQIYLYSFPFKKLYKEICVKRENKKNTLFFYKSQMKCLKHVKNKYLEYTQKIERYAKLDQWISRISLISIGMIFLMFVFGVIEYKPSEKAEHTISEKVTVTIIEAKKTTIKEYESLKDFFK